MNIDQFIYGHTQWRQRLQAFINGTGEALDSAKVQQDSLCALGKWLNGEGLGFRKEQAYWQVKAKHTTFHKLAAAVIRRAEDGDKAGARQLIGFRSEFIEASDSLVESLQELKRKVER